MPEGSITLALSPDTHARVVSALTEDSLDGDSLVAGIIRNAYVYAGYVRVDEHGATVRTGNGLGSA